MIPFLGLRQLPCLANCFKFFLKDNSKSAGKKPSMRLKKLKASKSTAEARRRREGLRYVQNAGYHGYPNTRFSDYFLFVHQSSGEPQPRAFNQES